MTAYSNYQNRYIINRYINIRAAVIVVCLLFFVANTLKAQTTQTLYYTTKDGLPSNSVYKTVLDGHGFLWIATEIGIAKFDGRNFKIYTTAQGLPDNEITDLFLDSNKVIWVTPFRKTPSYYNEEKDRFENEETDPELMKIELANTNRGSVLQYGGMAFSNNQRNFFIYKNKKVTAYKNCIKTKSAVERIIEYRPGNYILICSDSLRYFSNGQIIRSVFFGQKSFSSEYFNQALYIISGSLISKYNIDANGDVGAVLQKELPFPIRIFCRAGKNLVVTSFNGTTYPLDPGTLQLKDPLLYNVAIRNVMEDKSGSSWISTMDKGLVKIQQKRISTYTADERLVQNFNALIVDNKKIIAGNNYGEVLIYDGIYDIKKVSLSTEKNMDGTIRKIINFKDKIYVAGQNGSFIISKKNYTIEKRLEGLKNISSKSAKALNDSIVLVGTHILAYKYNIVTNTIIDSVFKRVTALGVGTDNKIYVGSNEGLYRWDKDSLFNFSNGYKTLGYRINTITATADGLMWVGLASDSLLVLNNDNIIASIPLGDIIAGNVCKVLYSSRSGEIWLGTNKGLNRLQYKFADNAITYNNTFFSAADGLTGEQVNDITQQNDTLYIATTSGISYLPVNLNLPINDIATFITRVSVNGRDTLVLNSYELPYDNNDININFSGVDLTGYFPVFEYRIDNGNWVRLEKNNIELRLLSGKYNIEIRAIKRDGQPSSQIAKISIFIKTPFWKSPLFGLALALILFIGVILFLQVRSRQKQKTAVEKVITEKKLAELEMQALKAQINPHFIFNCLNSIKGFLFDKDFVQADKYLDKFSQLLRSTLDNSSSAIISVQQEINYLDNYLQLEKLRFDNKFEYLIAVEDGTDKKTSFVPAMLLQPYVENAIRHGIGRLQDKQGQINIVISKQQDKLVCIIDDNGVGREKATTFRNRMHTEYQSRGMHLSKRRAELYEIEQEIIDKKDAGGNATGTTILLKIPITLKP